MQNSKIIAPGVYWLGADDRRLSLFENLFPLEDGVAYNTYAVMGEKTALIDTVDSAVTQQYLENLEGVLDGRSPDYLIVNHMEPDHCSLVAELMRRYPDMHAVGTAKVPALVRQFYGDDISPRFLPVKDGDALDLGGRTLHFATAPMVHWPEVMFTYDDKAKALFSADAFGSFGAHHSGIFDGDWGTGETVEQEMRRYYTNIVGKYGPQVLAALRKASALEIEFICPLHGPVWRNHIPWLLEKYTAWAGYTPEKRGALVVYGSMYGNTGSAASRIAMELAARSAGEVRLYDVSKTHKSYLVAEAFRLSHIVLAAPTYNAGIYPPVREFVEDLGTLGLKGRTAAIIENGSWAPMSGKLLREMAGALPGWTVLEPALTLRGAECGEAELEAFLSIVAGSINEQ
ncbi:MAG: FprA family A-type flavoprotein [Bacillota bacterium]|nr:FprA family A-type flavoprotein [Bacillota bacterium]